MNYDLDPIFTFLEADHLFFYKHPFSDEVAVVMIRLLLLMIRLRARQCSNFI